MLWDASSSSPILPVCNSHEEKCSRRDSRHGCQGWLWQQSPPLTDLLSHRKHTEGFSGCLEFGSNHRALRDGTFWESGTRALWCLSWVPCLTLSHLALIGCLLCCELPEKGPQEKTNALAENYPELRGPTVQWLPGNTTQNTLGERRCPHPGPASSSHPDEDSQPMFSPMLKPDSFLITVTVKQLDTE